MQTRLFEWLAIVVLMSALSSNINAKQYIVGSPDEYNAIASSLKAGDKVILQDGIYHDFELLLEGEGMRTILSRFLPKPRAKSSYRAGLTFG